ncbi:hypothetical protein GDO78_018402 [Eleutherodactylus coqui]|uniref:Alcohol dehydrogenase n=1 Tax=Eleutherodactylus coqui TaxID=57060 RepID=A0A8J6B0U3_ELECQ|nr:hypothetical protein GDO78_018402 [Eleutherodactylus coqui]
MYIFFLGYKSAGITKLVQDYICKKFTLDFLVSSRLKLDQINEAFDMINNKTGIRSIMIY